MTRLTNFKLVIWMVYGDMHHKHPWWPQRPRSPGHWVAD